MGSTSLLDRKEVSPTSRMVIDSETKLLKQINLVIDPEILAKTPGGNKLKINRIRLGCRHGL